MQVLDAYGIPLVTLTDTASGVPGEDQEAKGLLRHFGKILDTYATATIPKISIIIREAYGDSGSLVMGGVKSMGVDLCYAWPIAQVCRRSFNGRLSEGVRQRCGGGCLRRLFEPLAGEGGCV